jgi:hypothetical protein
LHEKPNIVRAFALTISSDRFAHGNRVAMNTAHHNTVAATFTRRHLPWRCSRITSSRPNESTTVPRTVFDSFDYDEQGRLIGEYAPDGKLIAETVWFNDLPIATLRPKGSNASAPLGLTGTTTGNPSNGATATNANNAGNNTITNRVNVEIFYIHPDHLGRHEPSRDQPLPPDSTHRAPRCLRYKLR